MDRDEFMELVYETFADEPDNVLANGIIEAADAYAEHEKAQLSQEGATSDLISKFIDGLEEIFADLRERHVDDSVCGLCEYDGAYMGQSGDWCNECPGFDKDDCFKLSDKTRKKWTEEIIKALPPAQPEHKVRFADKDHVWIDGKQYISLPRFQEAVKEAQPKEGHWIGKYPTTHICSECGWLIPDSKVKVFAYCPNCGAKMKGAQNG